ncbi:MAG: DNA ligase [Methyloprofundus sp.]|nr:DNA ligase [Methyloprofundus sp.]
MNNIKRQLTIYLSLVWILASISPVLAINKPDVMLAKVFHSSVDVTEYWISEKLDGVRARWDGHRFISRGGTIINAPDWFVEGFPVIPLDGELWAGRGEYQQTVSIVRTLKPHIGWKKVSFMVFDLPAHQGDFSARVAVMQSMSEQNPSLYLGFIAQFQVASEESLTRHLKTVTDQGGEGLMLHHKAGIYRSGRSKDLLKLKPFTEAEAIVLDYRKGKGQFTGKMGAIKVRSAAGKVFFIGSGFTHQQREKPPAIGSVISFRHQGVTDSGIPRFAVFLRVRDEP